MYSVPEIPYGPLETEAGNGVASNEGPAILGDMSGDIP